MDPEVEALLRRPTISAKQYLKVVPTETRAGVYDAIRRGDVEVLPGKSRRKHILTAPLRRKLGMPRADA